MTRTLLVLASMTCAVAAGAAQVSGPAKALDSTVVAIADQRFMLFGVDSVMRKQACTLDGKPWVCWKDAVHALQTILDQGTVTCDPIGEPDMYGRLLGRCSVNGKSVNEQIIADGFAVDRPADTKDYAAAEAAAKEKKLGLWRGQFQMPADFRRMSGIFVERP